MSGAEPMADETEQPAQEILRAGSSFARYEIVRCIGVGGMGAVFEATHSLLRKRVALKTMHTNLGRSEASRARFLREAETVARIRHPNVVDISDLGIENGIPYLVMDFLEGEDLSQLLVRRGELSPQAAVDIVVPVAAGLVAVHRLGIVHRDIKPENVFLARDVHGAITPKLIDFGVSKDLEASLRGGAAIPHTVTGTPHYMSPEQARGASSLDGRTDQYALGILLYQCLTGRLPYESTSLLELLHLLDIGEFTPIRALRAEVPVELEGVIHRAMSRHLRDRYPSMAAFGQALLPFASDRIRVTHEHEFSLQPMSTQETLLALDLRGRQSALTTPAAGDDPAHGPRLQTASGVRIREEAHAEEQGAQRPQVTHKVTDAVFSRPAQSRGRILGFMAIGAIVAAGALALIVRSAAPERPEAPTVRVVPNAFHLTVSATPPDATFELDGKLVGRGTIAQDVPSDGQMHSLHIAAPGYESQDLTFRDRAPDVADVVLRALPTVPAVADAPASEPETAKPEPARAHARSRAVKRETPAAKPDVPNVDIQLTR